MNQERVIDYQILTYKTTGEDDPLEFFEYLLKVEISKGWTPQGNMTVPQREVFGYRNYSSRVVGDFTQTMVKYHGFVTSKPPSYIKTWTLTRYKKGKPVKGRRLSKREKYKGDQVIEREKYKYERDQREQLREREI